MNTRYDVAIIGCGVIAPTHIEGYRSLPEVEVIHLCDLIPERVNALGDKYGIARRSVDYKELLADPEVDAVSVCTDHASHAQIVEKTHRGRKIRQGACGEPRLQLPAHERIL